MVIGAGFGGLAVVERLAGAPVDITVIDRNNYSTFQPLLYQVATAGLNSADVAYPIRSALRDHPRVDFRWAEVNGVDWDTRTLKVVDQGQVAGEVQQASMPFDQLVVAAGGATQFFGVEGAAEHSLPLYALRGAVALRNHVLREFEAAAARPDDVRDGALTVVVVGGGPTGVEVAGALSELFGKVFPNDYPGLDVARARVVLVEMVQLLGGFSDSSRRHAHDTLVNRGVEVRVGEPVASIDDTGVTFESGDRIAAHTVIWAAGVRAAPVAHVLGIDKGKGGRIVVDEHLRVTGHHDVWAIGDIAQVEAGPAGQPGDHLPGLAQVAIQGGHYVAGTIRDRAAGKPEPEPFRYRNKGIMATIGRRSAIAELPGGIRLSGTPAWLAWLGLHLVFLTGLRNRVSVMLNWAWNYLMWNPASRLIFEAKASDPMPDPEEATNEEGEGRTGAGEPRIGE